MKITSMLLKYIYILFVAYIQHYLN